MDHGLGTLIPLFFNYYDSLFSSDPGSVTRHHTKFTVSLHRPRRPTLTKFYINLERSLVTKIPLSNSDSKYGRSRRPRTWVGALRPLLFGLGTTSSCLVLLVDWWWLPSNKYWLFLFLSMRFFHWLHFVLPKKVRGGVVVSLVTFFLSPYFLSGRVKWGLS